MYHWQTEDFLMRISNMIGAKNSLKNGFNQYQYKDYPYVNLILHDTVEID